MNSRIARVLYLSLFTLLFTLLSACGGENDAPEGVGEHSTGESSDQSTNTILTAYINQSSDDGYSWGASSVGWDYHDTTFEFMRFGGAETVDRDYSSSYLFKNINIMQGRKVFSATLEFSEYGFDSDSVTLALQISGIDPAFQSTFSTLDMGSGRLQLPITVNWNKSSSSWTSPDITEVVQAIVNDSDWNLGDSMGFVIENIAGSSVTGRHNIQSFDNGSPTGYPKLVVTFNNYLQGDGTSNTEEEEENSAPEISLIEPSGLLSSRTQTLISINTNELASCKYSQSSGVDFDAMTGQLPSTNGLDHLNVVTGLLVGSNYTFFIKCQDDSGVSNTSDYVILFSIQSEFSVGDTIAELFVRELSGEDRIDVHARSGVPFPKGIVGQNDVVVLTNENNDVIYPVQTTPLALWPDGSVRWLLLNSQVDLQANETKKLNLNFAISEALIANAIVTEESAEFITVNTGVLRVEIPKTSGNMINRAFLNDVIVIDEPSDNKDRGAWVKLNDTEYWSSNLNNNSAPNSGDTIALYEAESNGSSDGKYNLHSPWTLDVAIEEEGPVVVVVKVSGTHLNSSGGSFSSFVTRMTFTRGSAAIKFQHTFIFTGAANDKVQGYGVKLPFVGDLASMESQVSSNGTLLQGDYDSYTVDGSNQQGQSNGSVSKGNDSFHMGVILRDMAENYPKALSIENDGINVELYPQDSNFTLNLERYDDVINGGTDQEVGSIGDNRSSQGVAKTDRFFVNFGSGSINLQEQSNRSKHVDVGPVMMFASPEWYSDSLVMGVGPFYFNSDLSSGSEVHFRIDRKLKVIEDFMRFNQRKQFGWYGMLEYGDIRGLFCGNGRSSSQVCDDGVFTWYKDGRYGWSANSGEPLNQLWIQFLRTVNQDVFVDAEAFATHQMDIPMIHYGDKGIGNHSSDILYNSPGHVGSVHRHGKQGWSGYAGAIDYSAVGGLETYYYLTGDYRARDVLYEAARFVAKCSGCSSESLRNGLDVLSRASSIFETYEDETLVNRFDQKIETMVSYLYGNSDLSGFIAQYAGSSRMEYFAQGGSFGLYYYYEKTADTRILPMVYHVADEMTAGVGGDAWGLANGAGSANEFYQILGVSYALHLAGQIIENTPEQQRYDRYYSLTKRILEQNCHSVSVGGATSAIPLSAFQNIPANWEDWLWEWPGAPSSLANPAISADSAYLLFFSRQMTFINDYMQDYHSYRAFLQLSAAAAGIPTDDLSLEPQ